MKVLSVLNFSHIKEMKGLFYLMYEDAMSYFSKIIYSVAQNWKFAS